MVLAGKIFKVVEPLDLNTIAAKLKGYRVEEDFSEESHKFQLITEIQDLAMRTGELRGLFSKDQVIHVRQRGEMVPILKTVEALFTFAPYKDQLYLTILEKKWRANNIANALSEILFITVGRIVEAKIPPEVLRSYHDENPEGTKVVFFSDVDIPNIDKLSLYGPSLANTTLYTDYLSHGVIWYIVIVSKRHGYTVGITRNSIVTVFNNIDPNDLLAYVAEEILPMIR